MEKEIVVTSDDYEPLLKPIRAKESSRSLSTECSDIPCSSSKIIKCDHIEGLTTATHNSSKHIQKLASISIPSRQKIINSIKNIDTLIPISGIDEVCMSEEDSPSRIQTYNRNRKLDSDVSKLTNTDLLTHGNLLKYESCMLPVIDEESKLCSKKNSELKINQFLDRMKIRQVYPSEINSLKLAMCISKRKPLAPKLQLSLYKLAKFDFKRLNYTNYLNLIISKNVYFLNKKD